MCRAIGEKIVPKLINCMSSPDEMVRGLTCTALKALIAAEDLLPAVESRVEIIVKKLIQYYCSEKVALTLRKIGLETILDFFVLHSFLIKDNQEVVKDILATAFKLINTDINSVVVTAAAEIFREASRRDEFAMHFSPYLPQLLLTLNKYIKLPPNRKADTEDLLWRDGIRACLEGVAEAFPETVYPILAPYLPVSPPSIFLTSH